MIKKEKDENYWKNLSLAEFLADYEIVYDPSSKFKNKDTKIQTLQNGKGCIRLRNERAVLRYYLSYDNDEDLARGLLILFLPFRDEMVDIHREDVRELLSENIDIINEKREQFEKYKTMTDLINSIQKEDDQQNNELDDDEDEDQDGETTDPRDIQDIENWAKSQASSVGGGW